VEQLSSRRNRRMALSSSPPSPPPVKMATDTEKLPLLTPEPRRQSRRATLARLSIPTLALFGFVYLQLAATYSPDAIVNTCPQTSPRLPQANEQLDKNRELIYSSEFRQASAGVLSGFVQVQYVSKCSLIYVQGDPLTSGTTSGLLRSTTWAKSGRTATSDGMLSVRPSLLDRTINESG
jgi:hypothetical protein